MKYYTVSPGICPDSARCASSPRSIKRLISASTVCLGRFMSLAISAMERPVVVHRWVMREIAAVSLANCFGLLVCVGNWVLGAFDSIGSVAT